MKLLKIRKIIGAFSLMGFLSLFNTLQAQFVVYDPAQFGNMIKSLANEVQVISNTAKTLHETKNILQTAIKTKEEIENIYSLQWRVQEALKVAGNIRDLKWSDLENVAQQALGVPIDPQVYLPKIPESYPLRQSLGGAPTVEGTRELYEILVGLYSESGPLNSYADYSRLTKELTINRFSLAEMTEQKKIQTALSYNQLAEEMIVQARELIRAVKTDRWLTMNEAERLSLLKQSQDVLMKSMEIKLQADELLQAVAEEPSHSKEALMQSYRNQLVRKALAETPQMKYGQQ